MGRPTPEPQASDADLIESARSGDTSAFAELWRRHYRAAARVARQFTSIDADDLVSEAYVRIYQRVLAGGGPTGAFRPYLYTTIRNLASTWGAANHDVQVDMIEDYEDDRIPVDPATWALDRTLTARAFRTLPDRWQTVLWYTEVEGMDPHEVAPLMGMTANGVAALSYRAREGLRKAWLQAHISDATAEGECQWALARLGDHARGGLGQRDGARMAAHLERCTTCTIVSEEVEEVGSHLALVMLPLAIGGVAGGALLTAMATPGAAMAAEIAIPALPAAVTAVATSGVATAAPAVAGAFAVAGATTTAGVVGSVALAAIVGGTVVLGGTAPLPTPHATAVAVVQTAPDATGGDAGATAAGSTDPSAIPGFDGTGSTIVVDPGTAGSATGATGTTGGSAASAGSASSGSGPATPGPLASAVAGVVAGVKDGVGTTVDGVGQAVGGIVDGVTAPLAPVATASVHLRGTGTPGAAVSLSAAQTVYASTTVGADGTFTLDIAAVPSGVTGLALVQKVDQSLLGGVLGTVTNLLKPLTVSINTSTLPISIG